MLYVPRAPHGWCFSFHLSQLWASLRSSLAKGKALYLVEPYYLNQTVWLCFKRMYSQSAQMRIKWEMSVALPPMKRVSHLPLADFNNWRITESWLTFNEYASSSLNQSINQSIYLMSWGATGTPQTRSSVHWIHTDNICFLHAKHCLRKPPHAFGSHKFIKSAIVQQCCRRFKCCDLTWLYAGQSKQSAARPPHNPMTCTLDTQPVCPI